jgi:hypothetical protein
MTTPEGTLLVLRPDPLSGELTIERAYVVAHDLERHLGDPGARHLHGYYLDDVEAQRREAIDAARARYEATIPEVALRGDLEVADAAAAALCRAGGADLLARDLEAPGTEPAAVVRRHAAALGLGEAGYRLAIPYVAKVLEDSSPGSDAARRAAAVLQRLTGVALDPGAPKPSADKARAWAAEHPLGWRFERA